MRRNLQKRVECVIEIPEEEAKERLIDLIQLALEDNRSAWDLHSDGQYVQRRPAPGEEERAYQDVLMRMAASRDAGA